MTDAALGRVADDIRRLILVQSKRANIGHIGSSLSIAEILAVLFAGPLVSADPSDPDRHRFILSKGHAALALYCALNVTGRLTDAALDSFCADGTDVTGHPEHVLAQVDFSTGSLGHGLSLAAGAALAARLQGSERRVYAVLSDAECDEGSVWEAAMFAAQHRLTSLCAIIDVNGQQALGYTRDVLDLEPLADRWQSFGWEVVEVDGHDLTELGRSVQVIAGKGGRPRVVLARTTFGRGVSFMENRIEWHYLPMSDDDYRQALEEVGRA